MIKYIKKHYHWIIAATLFLMMGIRGYAFHYVFRRTDLPLRLPDLNGCFPFGWRFSLQSFHFLSFLVCGSRSLKLLQITASLFCFIEFLRS